MVQVGADSLAAKWRVWANGGPALQMRLDFSRIPFAGLQDGYVGTDAWNGFPGELRELMSFVCDEGIGNLVSVAGDYHAFAAATACRSIRTRTNLACRHRIHDRRR